MTAVAQSLIQEYIQEQSLRRRPSRRNEKIFEAVRVEGRRQIDVAVDEKMSPQRVSQIVSRVAQWKRWRDAGSDAIAAHDRHRPSADALARKRADAIYIRSIRAFDDGDEGRVLVTTREREKTPAGTTIDKITRETGPNGQYLKTALRAMKHMEQIADRPQPARDTLEEQVQAGLAALAELRRHAEREKMAPRGRDAIDLVYRMMAKLLHSSPEELVKSWSWEDEEAPKQESRAPTEEARSSCVPEAAKVALAPEVTAKPVAVSAVADERWGGLPYRKQAVSGGEMRPEKTPAREGKSGRRLIQELKTQHEEDARASAEKPKIFATPYVCPPPGECPVLQAGEERPCDVCPTMHAARAELARSGDNIPPSHRAWLLHCAQLDRVPRS